MSGQQTRETPLAWSQSGDAFEVPDAAVLWRVRRLSGNIKGGAPELVYGPDGLPLMVDVTIGPGDFMEAVEGKPGKYRLDALDDLRKPVAGVPPAYFVVSSAGGPRAERHDTGTSDVALRTLAEALKQQSDKLGDAFKQQADQINGLITQVRDFAQHLAARPVVPEVAPAPVGAALGPRNGIVADVEEDEDDDLEEEEENDTSRDPDWFDRVQDFCTKVPPESLRVVGQMVGEIGPKVVADGVRNVIKEGIAGFANGDGTSGGGA